MEIGRKSLFSYCEERKYRDLMPCRHGTSLLVLQAFSLVNFFLFFLKQRERGKNQREHFLLSFPQSRIIRSKIRPKERRQIFIGGKLGGTPPTCRRQLRPTLWVAAFRRRGLLAACRRPPRQLWKNFDFYFGIKNFKKSQNFAAILFITFFV